MRDGLSYSGLQKILHWVIAALVLFMVPAGITMANADNRTVLDAAWGAGSFDRLYDLHKNVGLIVLALMLVRLVTRLVLGAPPYYPPLEPHERILSWIVHRLLYLLLIVTPIIGWVGISAYPALPSFFGLFQVPGIVGPDRALSEAALAIHRPLGLAIGLLVLLHMGAALYHGIVKGDGVFSRMVR